MLERLLPCWKGKLFVLVLLGFAATDFIITMTLSAADASAHIVENPHVPAVLHGHQLLITLVLLALLGAVFLKGFTEAIGIAVGLVAVYLALNVVVVGRRPRARSPRTPGLVTDWATALTAQHGNPLAMVGVALLVFPQAGARPVRLRDRRRRDAARPGRPGRHRGATRAAGSAAPGGC